MSPAPHEPGVAPSALGLVREAAALGVAALVTRGELAALELTEARERAARWMVLALVAGVLLLAALLVGSLWVVSIFWDSHRSEAIAVVATVYALAGGGLTWRLMARLRAAPPLLQATLNELKQDCDALRGARRTSP
ncbi:MAG TPA: phage holin family protein [Burkholderiaceae bacterium]|nr:phage holin family protein [Burkholderiaceae bacterium]